MPVVSQVAGDGNDRIVWFADKDGDGRHDERQVFADGLANVSALQWGFGGVWIVATPYLQFIPDKNADGKADGPPVTLLDGFDLNARHNVAAALLWGPDGWLYGCNGILSNSKIGKPGASDAERVAINCGVWRYHPVRHVFEPYAWGTTNPWGLDYNDAGQFFSTNCVIAHLWHVLPGAHFQRMFGQDLNPTRTRCCRPAPSICTGGAGRGRRRGRGGCTPTLAEVTRIPGRWCTWGTTFRRNIATPSSCATSTGGA